MVVGLVFFIRASTKARIETLALSRPVNSLALLQELTIYFEGRSYTVAVADVGAQRVVLRGRVRPSLFLAIFLTLLAAVGALCFALVLSNLWPSYGASFLGLLGLAPAAGWFYWRGSDRDEEILLQGQPATAATEQAASPRSATVTITAHRDELIALQEGFDGQQPVV